MATFPVRVLLVDDHQLFRIGLHAAISDSDGRFVVAGEASTPEEALALVRKTEADVLLLDAGLSDGPGFELARQVRRDHHGLRILLLASAPGEDLISRSLKEGLEGIVSKAVSVGELFRALEYVADGAEYYGLDIAPLVRSIRMSDRTVEDAVFTPRENQVIKLCAEGLSAKEISEALSINIATVNTHKNNIFKKLGINSSVDLVRYALKHGIITL